MQEVRSDGAMEFTELDNLADKRLSQALKKLEEGENRTVAIHKTGAKVVFPDGRPRILGADMVWHLLPLDEA